MPVVFKDLGKGAKDLLSKKYDFKNEIKTVNKADGGLVSCELERMSECVRAYVSPPKKEKVIPFVFV